MSAGLARGMTSPICAVFPYLVVALVKGRFTELEIFCRIAQLPTHFLWVGEASDIGERLVQVTLIDGPGGQLMRTVECVIPLRKTRGAQVIEPSKHAASRRFSLLVFDLPRSQTGAQSVVAIRSLARKRLLTQADSEAAEQGSHCAKLEAACRRALPSALTCWRQRMSFAPESATWSDSSRSRTDIWEPVRSWSSR